MLYGPFIQKHGVEMRADQVEVLDNFGKGSEPFRVAGGSTCPEIISRSVARCNQNVQLRAATQPAPHIMSIIDQDCIDQPCSIGDRGAELGLSCAASGGRVRGDGPESPSVSNPKRERRLPLCSSQRADFTVHAHAPTTLDRPSAHGRIHAFEKGGGNHQVSC